jgi:6-pyruvoyltetrahydropterin/6-carboxytetrahydropterin synthase
MTQTTQPQILTRTFRLAASPLSLQSDSLNGLVAGHAVSGVAAIGELEIRVFGTPCASGYLVDITILDRALRQMAAARFRAALIEELQTNQPTDVPRLLRGIADEAQPLVPAPIAELSYRPSPYRSTTVALDGAPPTASEETMLAHADAVAHRALLTETFEFAASHRLHLPSWSDEENRARFGKCNNPNGHGHNYRIEVAVAVEPDAALDFALIGAVVQREIMARFDHKHLNLDCPEFRELNPSVEHIARVSYGLLAPAFAAHRGDLRWVRVWETEKTSCRYPATPH